MVERAVSFTCTGCGAPLQIKAQGSTQVVACSHCGSVLDAQDPRHQVLSQYKANYTIEPTIPLGRRGTFRDGTFEVVGYLRRRTRYYGADYDWAEYLLWNPYKGFRWLIEAGGHWTFLSTLPNPPLETLS
ncbi:MAG: DUF4178 domain-containing protein [Elusimicrobia bacterium]|nr:DUF4178 domain-containing protein [Elusimicrobiota bacterium]